MKTIRYCVLIGLGIVLAGLIFEVGVRLFVPMSDFFWTADPVVGMKLIPNKRGRWLKPGTFDVAVQTNSSGFRDRGHSTAKPPGITRIVLLGDSYVEALQVPFEHSLTVLLDNQLRARGIANEVINLSVSGAGTAREYLMLREYGLRYQPDLVLLFLVGNDVANNSRRLEGLPYLPYPVPDTTGALCRDSQGRPQFTPIVDPASRLGYFGKVLKNYSRSYRFLRTTIERAPRVHALLYRYRLVTMPPSADASEWSGHGPYGLDQVDTSDAWVEAWSLTEELLLETKNLAEGHGARFAVVLVPAPWEVYPDKWDRITSERQSMQGGTWDPDTPSRRFRSFLTAHGIPHVALLPSFRARSGSLRPLYFDQDGHWTSDGHALAAELVAPRVEDLLRRR